MSMAKMPYQVFANWKMAGSLDYLHDVLAHVQRFNGLELVFLLPAPFLGAWKSIRQTYRVPEGVKLGAQAVHALQGSANTGCYDAAMVKEVGCDYVCVGHSECRQAGLSDRAMQAQLRDVLQLGMTPVFCVGESQIHLSEQALEYALLVQLDAVFSAVDFSLGPGYDIVIAYEPVWSIGKACASRKHIVNAMHGLSKVCRTLLPACMSYRLVYGGGVSQEAMPSILGIDHLAGLLIGRASHRINDFMEVLELCNSQ